MDIEDIYSVVGVIRIAIGLGILALIVSWTARRRARGGTAIHAPKGRRS